MDFWSRLLSPLSAGTSRQDQAKDPAKRLHRFEKEYGNLLSTWRSSTNLSRDSDAAETLEIRLQELTNILSDESRRPLPHPCIQYASIKQIYVPIGKIATTSYNEWIIKEAVLLFATLIESEEEAFVENDTFSTSLTNLLVRITGANSVRLGLDTESRVVELAFNITTKIRLDPDILPAWFKVQQPAPPPDGHGRGRAAFAGLTQRADFPLFYILMDYIHHEGKVGDFARTGLLYIIEAASSSALLEQWIVESDLSTLMATGLGALYSQLSRKLVIDHPSHDLPPILALSDYQHPTSSYEIVSSCSAEFKSHLETFLSHLLFWQDVLNHCRSVEVKSTLLEHFQVIFLQQLLYPSLLESSDIDGGSSVAVLTYLRRILESLDHPDMINLILHYLLALPDMGPSEERESSSISDARLRKSMDLATMMAERSDDAATPLLFNLVDLILACLRSRNQQTIHVTLQLVSAILKRHHRYAIITLLKTELLPRDASERTVGAHEQEIDYLMSLAGSIGGSDNLDDVYANVLKDTMSRLESHPCSLKIVAPRVSTNNRELPAIPDTPLGVPRGVRTHTLRVDDPLLNAMLDLLRTFFINPVETNLSVSETVVDLACCGYMRIDGWFARSPKTYSFADEEAADDVTDATSVASDGPESLSAALEARRGPRDAEAERLEAVDRCRRRPLWSQDAAPRLLRVLQALCDQVESYKMSIPRFEELLQQRREAFETADAMLDNPPPAHRPTPPPQMTPERPSMDEMLRTGSPPRPSAIEGIAQRLLSEMGTPSRSASPKGHRDQSRSPGALTPGTASSGAMEMMTPKAIRVPPRDFPIHHTDPGRSGSDAIRSLSPSSARSARSARSEAVFGQDERKRDSSAASQASSHAAVDQSILARRVGLPDDKLKPIALHLDRKPASGAAVTLDAGEEMEAGPEVNDADISLTALEGAEVDEEAASAGEIKVSVSHIITNVIIFQSFLLELASLMQVRAGMFDELRYV
ncbi:DNA polymerase epsilon subunit C [Drechmeria coniospora]|uniref:DNA polymerase epsilon subunit C n=1 Tax=Drechmeria coniospora TaxID=98403 RepID=A0A151GJE1_DRECN|nr:DNA polymerase epsilon subunit C [Drechmeria coniospora]KYK57132.1 DNA polymerase epsilon subunit C [Drechmeria coniospora]